MWRAVCEEMWGGGSSSEADILEVANVNVREKYPRRPNAAQTYA